ncbi:membrane protein insertion efficiency factor YidD [Streptomyces sp. NPDC127106]|uniref:membrane protein insertion efficiency factor YidD n=1 Tax=Streptomyces sp. NPDC127106 TaxID=3345360 RepID=UPI003644D793
MAKQRRKPDAERRQDEEGCVEGALDQCLMCRQCCPQMWIASLALALLRPASGGSAARAVDPAAPRPPGRLAARMYDATRWYRSSVSPTRRACCPYTPSCSTYAVKALSRHGALRGGRLIVGRLLRCRPATARRRGFTDPVPPLS